MYLLFFNSTKLLYNVVLILIFCIEIDILQINTQFHQLIQFCFEVQKVKQKRGIELNQWSVILKEIFAFRFFVFQLMESGIFFQVMECMEMGEISFFQTN
eukprot:TRINITY_DN28180_c0_g4_i1.p5 TRINITY_DN28180_c0_g4~~TRINITY_DN28180_c0_g4_i1.p5  ORF type:complete len:100 (+),score=4.23 TRINITY_DN28180_c0_g4_i1:800-1099(+)